MRTVLVSVENSLSNIGFRRLAARVRSERPELEVGFIVPFRATAAWRRLTAQTYRQKIDDEVEAIAAGLAGAEVLGFSSMSIHAEYTKSLIRAVRRLNPKAFIIWGGVHGIVDPEDAVSVADAVCTGEGEKALPELLRRLSEGRDLTGVGNFYFRIGDRIQRNPLLPLLSAAEMDSLPYPLFVDGELLHRPGQGFRPLALEDYVRHEGLTYNVLWAIGCPNRCVYCGNSRFLKNDHNYARLRYRSVDRLLGEVQSVRARVPQISAVTFQDDCFMSIPLPILEELAAKWRERIGLPFAVTGLISRNVDAQKIRLLIAAGMFRVRMGIQSGSARTLRFFRRPDSVDSIRTAVNVIHRFRRHMMTPSYDVIVDNPTETAEDVSATVELLHSLPRPFILNAFPLMRIPNTELAEVADRDGLSLPPINTGKLAASLANALVLSSVLVRLPERLLARWRARLARSGAAASISPVLFRLILMLVAIRRGLAHLRFGNLSVLPSRLALTLWRIGLVRRSNRRLLRKCASVAKME